MRSFSRSIQIVFLVFLASGLTACAASGGGQTSGAEPSGDEISVQVRNDISPPTSVVIWVVTENGRRIRLGPVPSNARRTLGFEPQVRAQRVHLVAVPEGPTTGTMRQVGERTSNEFSLVGVQSVSWTVSRQNVEIGG